MRREQVELAAFAIRGHVPPDADAAKLAAMFSPGKLQRSGIARMHRVEAVEHHPLLFGGVTDLADADAVFKEPEKLPERTSPDFLKLLLNKLADFLVVGDDVDFDLIKNGPQDAQGKRHLRITPHGVGFAQGEPRVSVERAPVPVGAEEMRPIPGGLAGRLKERGRIKPHAFGWGVAGHRQRLMATPPRQG
uniref:hypothetical protein n=1 Tax=Zavarzinella formosa TaxID=360055 RepID=UPI00138AF3D4|nr:hypothetical protein [Zavarzinella formosa]